MRPPVTINRSTTLDATADRVWQAVTTPAAFRLVTRGLIRWQGAPRWRTEPWREGESLTGLLVIFGVLPLSRHTITMERIDHDCRELQSDEHGGAIRSWRHLIRVTPVDEGSCVYEDIVVIDAGVATPVVATFARWFYGVRQQRWEQLAHVLG